MSNISSNNDSQCHCQEDKIDDDFVLIHEIFGYCGALGVSLILIPQVLKTYREKNVSGLPQTFLVLNLWTGCTFLTYGLLEHIMPMIISNIIALCSSISLLIMWCRYKNVQPKIGCDNGENTVVDNQYSGVRISPRRTDRSF